MPYMIAVSLEMSDEPSIFAFVIILTVVPVWHDRM